MRLLKLSGDDEFSFTKDILDKNEIPPYAILSHTWQEDQEVTFDMFSNDESKSKAGYDKLRFCAQQAKHDGLEYFWVDTCCINKADAVEFQDAINSMFGWYQKATQCYVYLVDVSTKKREAGSENFEYTWEPAFRRSRWFTRGWTLQELIAPHSVKFFSKEGTWLGDKKSLERQIHGITGIPLRVLQGAPLDNFSKEDRLSWLQGRHTTRKEDRAYSMLGIFGIFMVPIYGEGEEHAFKRLHREIVESLGIKVLSLDNDQRRILLDSLRFDQIDARQMTIKNAHAKTCKWLLTKPEYVDWLDTTKAGEHGFLWIKGKPGTGKSTLMKFALAHARKLKDRTIISFFFNARGENMEKSTIGAYRSLLLQLLEKHPTLQCVFDSACLSSSSIKPAYEWAIEPLKSLLEQAVQNLRESSIVCFIDALDECEEEQVRDMIQFFERVLSVSPGIRFQVCFASRHYPHITIRNGRSLVLEGQEGHSQDITNYLQSELKIGNSKIAQQIRRELQEKASGVFMWVVLVIGILNKEYDRGRIHALQRRLREIPDDLHTLFRNILTRDSDNMDELLLCIQWVLFAKQPLSPEQLYFAVLSRVEPEAISKWDPDKVTKDVIKLFILGSSKGLAEITTSKNQTVQFIHESVRDFLLKEDGLGDLWPNLRSNLQGQCHERLKQCCLAYMSTDVFAALEIPKELPQASSPQAADLRKSANEMFPFLEYAVQNVLHHADLAEGSGIAQRNFILGFPRPSWIKLANLFERHGVRRYTEEMSLMYVFGERNMPALVRADPSAVSCFEVGKERYGTPFFAASATGSKQALQAFVDALSKESLPGSCFHNIQVHNYEDRVDPKFGRNFRFSDQRSVLSCLAELGNEATVKLLLSTGKVDVNAKDNGGRSPLSRAAEKGHEAVVKLLLSTGKVHVNAKSKFARRTPLLWAAEYGQPAVVKLLLSTGKVDVNAKDNSGRSPLLQAAEKGDEVVVKLLLSTGKVNIDAKDNVGRTSLSWAAEMGHEAVVKLLLSTGEVNINVKDKRSGQTPLSWAAKYGREAVVKLLLSTGMVDVDAKDNNGQTPLSWAAMNGWEAVVKLLLSTDKVDVNAKDNGGRSPLSRAAEKGHEGVVKSLRAYRLHS
jgi:ankyrin repeat protein